MQGVVLAGGTGTRLRPATRAVNKHVIPVYDRPMIYYPVETLLSAGVDEIVVVTGQDHVSTYRELLEVEFDVPFRFVTQAAPRGVAHAVGCAREYVDDEFLVMLGDNVLLDPIAPEHLGLDGGLAKIFLTRVEDASAYGVADVQNGRVRSLHEKPAVTRSDHAVIGLYRYTRHVFSVIDDLEPSERGELEITDVNRAYLEADALTHEEIDGPWYDAGTPEGLYEAARAVRERRQGTEHAPQVGP